jgi:hypothetical protein
VTSELRSAAAAAPPRHRWLEAAVVLAVIAALLLRLLAARGDLWFDEVWTLRLLSRLRSPFEIFSLRHDNNHLLNSWLMWFLRSGQSDYLLRMPAVLLGTLAVAAAAWAAALGDDGPAPSAVPDVSPAARGLMAALLVGGSFLLIQYGSEARGYAAAMAFGHLAFAFAQKGRLSPGSRWAIPYGLAVLLALAGHAVAVHVMAGVVAWSMARWRRQQHGLSAFGQAFLRWHALPLLGAGALYVGFLRGIAIGGGARGELTVQLAHVVAYAAGLPATWSPVALLALAGLVVAGSLWAVRRSGNDQWIAYAVTIVVSPALVQWLNPSRLNYERYFIISATFGLCLTARALGLLAARSSAGVVAAALVTLTVVGGSTPRVARLLVEQRGHYRAALQFMLDHSPGPVVVSSDHHFRNNTVLSHYAERLGASSRLVYLFRPTAGLERPDWLIYHRADGEAPPEAYVADGLGNRYELQAEYPSAPLSGFRWYLFRRISAAPAPIP